MAFYKKRDHVQIIAEILNLCQRPQTKTNIRRQTSMSYAGLQNCVVQLLLSHWLEIVEEDCGQKKLAITEKGMIFLEKYLELQEIIGLNNKRKSVILAPEINLCWRNKSNRRLTSNICFCSFAN